MSRMRPTRPGTSNTSCRHSRTVSSTIGNVPYWLATESSCAERCRCCHNGVRRPAAAAAAAVPAPRTPGTWPRTARSRRARAVTSCSTSSGASAAIRGRRRCRRRPAPASRCRRRCAAPARPWPGSARAAGPRSPAPTARAPGRRRGCGCTSRQSPSSSRNRSIDHRLDRRAGSRWRRAARPDRPSRFAAAQLVEAVAAKLIRGGLLAGRAELPAVTRRWPGRARPGGPARRRARTAACPAGRARARPAPGRR